MNQQKERSSMNKATFRQSNRENVNVTLESSNPQGDPLSGKKYPCCLCGNGLEILLSRRNKPYTICLGCGVQTFFRGKAGIKRLIEIVSSELLIVGSGSKPELAVVLFNRIQQLRAQKKELEGKQGLILFDPDFKNAIRAVESETKRVQGELARLGRKARREKNQ
jgi:hypothetical protein